MVLRYLLRLVFCILKAADGAIVQVNCNFKSFLVSYILYNENDVEFSLEPAAILVSPATYWNKHNSNTFLNILMAKEFNALKSSCRGTFNDIGNPELIGMIGFPQGPGTVSTAIPLVAILLYYIISIVYCSTCLDVEL